MDNYRMGLYPKHCRTCQHYQNHEATRVCEVKKQNEEDFYVVNPNAVCDNWTNRKMCYV